MTESFLQLIGQLHDHDGINPVFLHRSICFDSIPRQLDDRRKQFFKIIYCFFLE